MESFGDKLKQEREAKDVTIEQIALASGIQSAYFEALEKNEFQALPGPAFGKLYIRAFAEVLHVDPRPLIEDYDRELRRRQPAPAEPARPDPDRPRRVEAALAQWREEKLRERGGSPREQESPPGMPPPEPGEVVRPERVELAEQPLVAEIAEPAAVNAGPRVSPAHGRRFVALVALIAGGLVLGSAVVVMILSTSTGEVHEKPPPPIESAPPQKPIEAPAPPPRPRPSAVAPPPAHLEVSAFGVGRSVGRAGLEEPVDTFAKGDVAYFSTRVLGGSRGGRVRHVWLFEGRVQQTIQLRLGGPSWHTYSSKTLGNAGQWAVEARDHGGRVLARATFTCS